MGRSGEFDLIRRYLRPIADRSADALELRDDAAVLTPPPGERIVVTADALVEGVHFLPDDPAETVAKKLLRVNLSDLAAMGARPWRHMMTFASPAPLDEEWFAAFCKGLDEDQARFDTCLAGGDMTRTEGPRVITLTAMGLMGDRPITRSGAQAGDDLWVSGVIGDSFLGLQTLMGAWDAGDFGVSAIARFRTPEPRLKLSRELVGLATACIDVSDGLLADLDHIAEASGVGLSFDARLAPLSEAGRAYVEAADDKGVAHRRLLTGGDDYELAFTARSAARPSVEEAGRRSGTPVTRIGSVIADRGDAPLAGGACAPDDGGWRHF